MRVDEASYEEKAQKRAPLTELVQCKADSGLVYDFDTEVARIRKTRSEVIRELIQLWVNQQKDQKIA